MNIQYTIYLVHNMYTLLDFNNVWRSTNDKLRFSKKINKLFSSILYFSFVKFVTHNNILS